MASTEFEKARESTAGSLLYHPYISKWIVKIFAAWHTVHVKAPEVTHMIGKVVSQRLHSIPTYEYSYPVGARNVSALVVDCTFT